MKKLSKQQIEEIKNNRYSGLTQKQLAKAIGVSQATISQVLNKKEKFIPFTAKVPAQELKEVLKQSANRIEQLEKDVRCWMIDSTEWMNKFNEKSLMLNTKTVECGVWRKAAIGFLTAWGVTIVGGVLLILSLMR